jgi:hypothetical protein
MNSQQHQKWLVKQWQKQCNLFHLYSFCQHGGSCTTSTTPSTTCGGFIRDEVTYNFEGDTLPDLAVQDEDDDESLCHPVAATARIVTDEKAPCIHLACL